MILKRIILQMLLLLLFVPISFGQPREVKIEGTDMMRYTVETIKAKAGETIKITLTTVSKMDKSQMAHNWVLLKPGTDAMDFVTKGLQHPKTDYIDPSHADKVIAKPICLGVAKPAR
jgi:azurin